MTTQNSRNRYDWTALACIWEASARKAGNVHPELSFSDLTYADFVLSALAIAPVFAASDHDGVGGLVLAAIQATRRVVRSNTNLGIVLLLAPLALAPPTGTLRETLPPLLDSLTVRDAQLVYEAIRLAVPGGMGAVATQDVRDTPTLPLRDVMALAAERDLIARQYVNGYRDVLDHGVPILCDQVGQGAGLAEAIIATHLELLAHHGDSLIARKCGHAIADEARRHAQAVLDAGWPHAAVGQERFAQFDAWLRADGNRRNPGATADLVTACIFAALRDNSIGRFAWM